MGIEYFKESIFNNFDIVLLRRTIFSAIIMLLGTGCGFLLQIIIARILGADGFGDYAYALTWIISLTAFGALGFDVASIKFVAAYNSSCEWAKLKGFLKASNRVVCICSITASVLLIITVSALSNFVNVSSNLRNTFLIAAPLLIILSLIQMYGGALRGLGSTKQSLVPQTIMHPALLIVLVAALSSFDFFLSSSVVMLVNVMCAIAVLFLQIVLINKAKPKEVGQVKARFSVKEWVSVSLPMGLTSGSLVLSKLIDILIVGAILGTKQAGIYAIASRIAKFASFGLQAVNTVVAPKFATMSNKEDRISLQYLATKSAWLTFLSATPVILLLYGCSGFILNLFGEEFAAGVIVLDILLVGELINTLSGSNGLLMNMTYMQREQAKILSYSLSLLILSVLLFTYFWGVVGAAIATALVISIRNLLILLRLWKLSKINATIFPYHRWLS